MYCGSEIVVREAIQKAEGPSQKNYLGLAEIALNAGKYQEVLDYCSKALELDFKNPEAWYLKGVCGPFNEMRSNFQNAIKYANNENLKQEYKSKILNEINNIIINHINIEANRYDPFKSLPEFEWALTLKPNEVTTMKNIVTYCEVCIADLDRRICNLQQSSSNPFDERIKELKSNITKFTETKHAYVEKIKKLDPSYTEKIAKLAFEGRYDFIKGIVYATIIILIFFFIIIIMNPQAFGR